MYPLDKVCNRAALTSGLTVARQSMSPLMPFSFFSCSNQLTRDRSANSPRTVGLKTWSIHPTLTATSLAPTPAGEVL